MSNLTIVVRTNNGNITMDIAPETTIKALKRAICEITGYSADNIELLHGYPMKTLGSSDEETLQYCGVRSGQTFSLSLKTLWTTFKPQNNDGDDEKIDVKSGTIGTKLQAKDNQKELDTKPKKRGIELDDHKEPDSKPRKGGIELNNHKELDTKPKANGVGLNNLEEPRTKPKEDGVGLNNHKEPRTKPKEDGIGLQQYVNSGATRVVMRKEIPADNSCVFTGVMFLISGAVDPTLSFMARKIIAEAVKSKPEEYTSAILDKDPEVYYEWIQDPVVWGGGVELSILSHHYGIQIVVANILTGTMNRFGEDKQYDTCGYLIFDGVHYDALYAEVFDSEGSVQTLFPVTDEEILLGMEQLMMEAKASNQYVDLPRMNTECSICHTVFSGSDEIKQHCITTGHDQYGQVPSS